MNFCLGLLLPLCPSILSSIISLCREKHFNDLSYPVLLPCLIMSIKDLFSSISFNTSSFVLYSVQLILFILLHIHISKASIHLTSSFLIVQVSALYNITLHISALTILFFRSLFSPPLITLSFV